MNWYLRNEIFLTNLHNNSNHHQISNNSTFPTHLHFHPCRKLPPDRQFIKLTIKFVCLTFNYNMPVKIHSSISLSVAQPCWRLLTADGQKKPSNSRRLSSTSLHPCAESQSQAQARTSTSLLLPLHSIHFYPYS